jgi:ABC-type nickel/cobalt efflux system permease component RcnA
VVINSFSLVLIGFVLGMRHATDPDHVIAVATIVSREQRISSALLIGALWGIGHSITILLVGGAILLFDVVIPPRLGLSMEFSVALMLILLGVMNLTGALRWIHDALSSSAPDLLRPRAHLPQRHAHDRRAAYRRLGAFHALRPLVVGVVHGLAGSAAIALLVLATIQDAAWGVAYLVVFGAGTIAGMMLITAANAVPFALTVKRFGVVNRYLGFASGLLSLGFGLFLAYHIGFVDGLFSDAPTWTPG